MQLVQLLLLLMLLDWQPITVKYNHQISHGTKLRNEIPGCPEKYCQIEYRRQY